MCLNSDTTKTYLNSVCSRLWFDNIGVCVFSFVCVLSRYSQVAGCNQWVKDTAVAEDLRKTHAAPIVLIDKEKHPNKIRQKMKPF